MAANVVLRALFATCALLGLAGAAAAQAPAPDTVIVGRIEGVINPVTARYVDRLIEDGEQRGVAAVVFTINTPGGLLDSTTRITSRMLTATVPVITYVSPAGSRAASAGTFITMAGHVAAMAPSTNIGAAHPVDSAGGQIEGDLRTKVENDAVAQIRGIATARGRNADWAEAAVRESVSITSDEALELEVVDLIAASLADLLREADGREVELPGGTARLATSGTTNESHPFSPLEGILHFITDPQVAILLFTIGTYGLIFELSNPSLIFPGVVGVIAILLALFAIGTLEADAAGLALMVFAVIFFVAEFWVPSHGILTAGGIAAMVLGAILLFPPGRPTLPGLRLTVEPLTIALIAGTSGLFFLVLARASRGYLHLPTSTGVSLVVGATGVAKSDVDPSGIVRVAGEDWTATTSGDPIKEGEPVTVQKVDGVRLVVARVPEEKGGA
ncbi:MAG: NfeD family protein [Candidatus Limnocylindria bacterium]